jgi:transposase
LIADQGVMLELTSVRRTASCSLCSRRSHRVHSRYERTMADLPWAGQSVTLRLHVRRFFCGNRRRPRRASNDQHWLRRGGDGPRPSIAACLIWSVR